MSALDRMRAALAGARPAAPREAPAQARLTAQALELWREAGPALGSPVEAYLAGRSLALPASISGEALRFHPACPFRLEERLVRLPAMLALMRRIAGDEPVAVHRTALRPDGRAKSDDPRFAGNPKRVLGPSGGAAVKLDADDAVTLGLFVSEGIESGLAGRQLGFAPAWALGSSGAVRTFPVLGGIDSLGIFGEGDAANAEAVRACAGRWRAAGREVRLIQPRRAGADMNDITKEIGP